MRGRIFTSHNYHDDFLRKSNEGKNRKEKKEGKVIRRVSGAE